MIVAEINGVGVIAYDNRGKEAKPWGRRIKETLDSSSHLEYLFIPEDGHLPCSKDLFLEAVRELESKGSDPKQLSLVLGLMLYSANSAPHSFNIDQNFRILSLNSKISQDPDGLAWTGLLYFKREFASLFKENMTSLEIDLISPLLLREKIYGIPLGREAPSARPCLFLDRDGVIIHDKGYLNSPKGIVFFQEIFPLIREATHQGFRTIVLTNQSGIGKGLITLEQDQSIRETMQERFDKEGITLDGIYTCPYHPKDGKGQYLRDSIFRKPKPGMLLQAMQDFSIDLKGSIMVGDKDTDILQVPFIKTVLVKGNYHIPSELPPNVYFASDHGELYNLVKGLLRKSS